jgi:hypothetical protein
MKNIYRIIFLLLVVSFTACTSTQSNMFIASDEEEDVGLGGTGVLANNADSDSDNGLGGTGILGEITGFGSIFVNGIEIEYNNKTKFTIDGEPAAHRQLEIGDVVEVLTVDMNKHTLARVINLRHEVIGKVEIVNPQTFSFIVQGKTIIQSGSERMLPEVGSMVAVSGFRVDEHTIMSTRVIPTIAKSSLVRTGTELPFKSKASHWLVQMHVQDDTAVFQLQGVSYSLSTKQKEKSSYTGMDFKVLKLRKPETGQLELERIIDSIKMPRGKPDFIPMQWRDGSTVRRPLSRSMRGPGMGSGFGSGAAQRGGGRK